MRRFAIATALLIATAAIHATPANGVNAVTVVNDSVDPIVAIEANGSAVNIPQFSGQLPSGQSTRVTVAGGCATTVTVTYEDGTSSTQAFDACTAGKVTLADNR